MARIMLIHWNATEIGERVERIRRAGHQVTPFAKVDGAAALRKIRRNPPDAVVIDLARLPSHGSAVGVFLRQQKATRKVPLVYIEADPEKTAKVRRQIPDAVYTNWRRIRSALRSALERPPAEPVVPGTMDGYSGTPLPKKLGIKPGHVVTLLSTPDDFERILDPITKDISIRKQARGGADVIMLFVKSRADLNRRLEPSKRIMNDGARLWIAWPKKASGIETDVTQNDVRRTGLDSGLVDYKICAIDAVWSGLRFARRAAPARGSA